MLNIIVGTAGHIDHGKTALVRALTGIDIAWVFQFLASAEASYVNGQLLVVDGARSLAGLD